MSALCVTGAGIFLFNKKFGFVDSPKYPDSAKEQIWERVPADATSATSAAAAADMQTNLRIVPYVEGRALLQRGPPASDVDNDNDSGETEIATGTAIFDGVNCRYLNDCRMLFATREAVPASPVWNALSQREFVE